MFLNYPYRHNFSDDNLTGFFFQFELQGFLLFLLKCECGKTIHSLSDIEPPGWWPAEVAFVDDLLGRNTKKGVRSFVFFGEKSIPI